MMKRVKKSTNRRGLKFKKQRQKKSLRLILVLLSIAMIITLFKVKPFILNKAKKQHYNSIGIEFKKEGQLSFYCRQNNEIVSTIDIEIAEDDYERALGLMHRYSMSDNHGMLFIMKEEEQQSFWMKNTYISLDIMFLNENYEIVKIHKYTEPLSEEPIPSIEKSKYIVEVIEGFCDKFKIKEGDFVRYNRTTTHNNGS
jgi:uncharacterized membrane protein (UPF0127 family)